MLGVARIGARREGPVTHTRSCTAFWRQAGSVLAQSASCRCAMPAGFRPMYMSPHMQSGLLSMMLPVRGGGAQVLKPT